MSQNRPVISATGYMLIKIQFLAGQGQDFVSTRPAM
jgi:hypothetical protein